MVFPLLITRKERESINKNNLRKHKAWHQIELRIECRHENLFSWGIMATISLLIQLFTRFFDILWLSAQVPVTARHRMWRMKKKGSQIKKTGIFLCQTARSKVNRCMFIVMSESSESDIIALCACLKNKTLLPDWILIFSIPTFLPGSFCLFLLAHPPSWKPPLLFWIFFFFLCCGMGVICNPFQPCIPYIRGMTLDS